MYAFWPLDCFKLLFSDARGQFENYKPQKHYKRQITMEFQNYLLGVLLLFKPFDFRS